MSDEIEIIWILMAILAFAVALNLFLTFRLSRISLAAQFDENTPLMLPAGESVEDFTGAYLTSGQQVSIKSTPAQAYVFLFLSSRCSTCRSKLPELERILPTSVNAGITTWLLSIEPVNRLKNFLKDSKLTNHVVLIDDKTSKYLNPRSNSPSYIFLDEAREVQASGNIGDANWNSFLSQMDEIQSEGAE